MSMEKKNYLKDLTKSGYLLIALLIASLAMTAFVVSYDYGLFATLYKFQKVLKYVIVVFAVFAVVTILYLVIGLRFKKTTLCDSFYLAMIIVGIAFFAYIGIAYGSFNVRRILVPVISLVVGLAFTTIRIVLYNKINKAKQEKNLDKIRSYFSEIVNKFSLFAIIVAAGIVVCVAYKLFNPDNNGRLLKNTNFLIVSIVCLVPLIVYSVKGTLVKHVTTFDALLLSGVVSLPAILIQILISSYSETSLTVWAIIVALYLVCVLVRFIRYTPSVSAIKNTCSCKCYFKSLFVKEDMLLAISIAGVIAFVAVKLLCSRALHNYLFDNGATLNEIKISLKALPTLVIAGSALAALAFFALMSLLGANKKTVGIGDFFLAICTLFVLFGFITLIAYPSSLYLYMLIAFAVYCLVMIIIRAIVVSKA